MSDQFNQSGPDASRPYGTPDPQQQQGFPQQQGYPQQQGFGQQQPYPGPPAPNYPPGYQQPYGGQSPYGVLPEHPQGTIILVLGILGFVVGPVGIAAWIMGSKAEKEIAASGFRYSNEGSIKTGKILGIVFTILSAVGILAAIAYVVIMLVVLGGMMSLSGY